MANKWTDSGTNPNYFNSTEQRNVKPDYSKTVYITLPTSTVTLKGYVSADGKPIKGIVVYLWQHGGQAAWGPETNDKGEWSQVVPRWVWSGNDGREDHRIQIIANKPGTEYRYNAEYTTSEEISNVLPADDYTAKSLTLESKWVTLGGTVTRYDSVAKKDVPLKDIWVFFWRQDGKKAFHVQTDANGKYSAKVEKYRGDCKIPTSGCYNIAYNKDDKNYPDKPKNPNYDTKERSDVKPYNNWDTINQRLDPGSVKFSGKVTNTTHSSGVPNIWVSGKRLDNRASFLVQTDKDGKWSVQVEKFTEADHRFVVVANPSERSNPWYRNSTPETVQPNYDRTINPVLVVSRVTFSGKIYVSGAVAGNFPIIPITFERDDRAVTRYVNTRSDGTFTIQLDGCTSRYCTYTITANKGGPGYPKNTLYNTPAAITGKWSDRDQTSLSFTLTGGPVPTTTTPAPAPSITSVTPTEGGRSLTISNFIVTGTNFASGAKVKLTRSGSSDMTASVSSVTSTKITASFGIPSNAATGTWNVVVTNPDGKVATRTGAFTVKDVVSPLPNPNEMEVKDLNGEMISPTEFGIGMSVRYPAALPAATKRYVRVVATINGKRLDRTFDVTQYTSPGNVWSTQSGGQVSTATPLRFNLATEGVSKFSTDLPVPVSVTVSYDGETETKSASRQAEVRIPVIIFHGACPPEEYPHCTVKNGLIDPLLNYAGYEPLSIHLRSRGFHDGNGYRNLYAPGLTSAMYKHPQQAVPSDILNDVELKVADAKASSYSTRVNLVGHSFGGLVSQYYASQRPENVQKVITVGTPFKGITNIYNAMFSPKWNRAMVDANITTPGGQPNLLLWGVPKDYTAYTLPSNPPAGINVQVTNSYTYTPHSRVEYHYIYANNIDTDKTITLALNEEGTWYRSVSVSKAKGDGTVLVESGSNTPGPTGSNIFRHPVQVGSIEGSGGLLKTNHGSLMMDNLIHEEVMNAVDRGTPLWNTW
ncbi:MAG: alpha/beta hydrolase [Methanomicrobiales archaeon]|nr:alpha/beta hydrolase [Methanomicrobiales archaeon]